MPLIKVKFLRVIYNDLRSVQPRAADHMCRRAVYQLPVPSTATAAEKQIFK